MISYGMTKYGENIFKNYNRIRLRTIFIFKYWTTRYEIHLVDTLKEFTTIDGKHSQFLQAIYYVTTRIHMSFTKQMQATDGKLCTPLPIL